MPRKQTPTLTEAELKIMKKVWDIGEASVSEVLAAWDDGHPPAYNTVLTTMRILERKGYLGHIKRGRAYLYRPLVNQEKAQRKALSHMVKNFFDGSPELLVLSLLKDENLSQADIKKLEELVSREEK